MEQPLNFRSPFINTRGGRQAPGSLCFGFQAAGYCHRIACCESRTAASVCFKYLFTQRQNKERAFKNTRAQLVAEGRAAAPPGSPVPVLTEVLASGLVGGSNRGSARGRPGPPWARSGFTPRLEVEGAVTLPPLPPSLWGPPPPPDIIGANPWRPGCRMLSVSRRAERVGRADPSCPCRHPVGAR